MPYDKDLHELLKATKRAARSPVEATEKIKKSHALGSYRCYGVQDGKIQWAEEIIDTPLRQAIAIGRQVAAERECESFEIWEGKERLHNELRKGG